MWVSYEDLSFKNYVREVQAHLSREFQGLVSYNRFVRLMPRVADCLSGYARSRQGICTGVSCIDSTPLRL